MNREILTKSIRRYVEWIAQNRAEWREEQAQRAERKAFFQSSIQRHLQEIYEEKPLQHANESINELGLVPDAF